MAKILVVEDDIQLATNLVALLARDSHVAEAAYTGADGLALIDGFGYDLLILDWELPDTTGLEILRNCRRRGLQTPALFLTGQKDLRCKEAGFETGADDYVTKPFESSELRLRVKALLRRAAGTGTNERSIGPLSLNLDSCTVTVDGKGVALLPKEYALLEFMSRHPKRVFNADELLSAVWSSDTDSSANTVRTYMYTLRKKITTSGSNPILHTVYGVGYKLDPDFSVK